MPTDGASSVSASTTDAAGNPGSTSNRSFVVDTATTPAPTIATVAGDNVVNLAEATAGVSITGTAEGNALVDVTIGTTTMTVSTDGTGAWSANFASGDFPADGSATVSAVATDASGNASTSTYQAIEINTAPPGAPTFSVIAIDDVINASEKAAGITISGTVVVGSTVDITIGGTTKSAAVDGSGNWNVSLASSEIPGDGSATVSATATDSSGNVATSTRSLIIDTGSTTPTISTVSGNNEINATDAAAGIEILGTAEAGASVTVTFGAVKTVTADASGNWSLLYSVAELPADGSASASAFATDVAGNTSALATQAITIDTTPPSAPVIALISGDDSLSYLEAVNGVTLSGTAEVGATIDVTLGSVAKSIVADISGNWSVDYTARQLPADGTQTVTVTATDTFGNASPAATRDIFLDSRSPGAPIVDTISADDIVNATEKGAGVTLTGTAEAGSALGVTFGTVTHLVTTAGNGTWSANFTAGELPTDGNYTTRVIATDAAGNVSTTGTRVAVLDTSTNAPTISVIASNDAISATEKAAGVDVSGTAEAGALVSVAFGTGTKTATAGSDGSWSVNFASVDIPGDGAVTVTATASDVAGNAASSSSRAVTVDATAPVAPTISIVATDDVISAAEKTAGFVVNGTADSGASVEVTIGGTSPSASVSTQTATADGTEAWSVNFISSDVPAEGTATISATATDLAGNRGSAGTRTVTVDTTAPSAPAINTVASDDAIDATEKAAGIAVTGSAVAGDTVDVTFGTTTHTTTAASDGSWSVNFLSGEVPADGLQTVSAISTDPAGNPSTVGTRAVTIETMPPAAPVIGAITSDDVVNAAEKAAGITISGTAEANSSVAVALGAATVTVSADGTGAWTTTFAAADIPADGAVTVTATATDSAGNQGAQASHAFSIDSTAAATPTIDVVTPDNVVNAAEKLAGVTVSGTAEANSSVAVTLGATTVTVSADGTGAWATTFAAADIPADGAATVTATATDGAGNVASAAPRSILIDTVAPTTTPTINVVEGNDIVNGTESENGVIVTGQSDASTDVAVQFGATNHVVTSDVSGNWSASFTRAEIPADGSVSISATATDAAGNTSAAGTRQVEVDAFINVTFLTPHEQSDISDLWNATVFNINSVTTISGANGFTTEATDPAGMPTGIYKAEYVGSNLTFDATTGQLATGTITSLTISVDNVPAYRMDGAGIDGAAAAAAFAQIMTTGDPTLFDALFADYRAIRTGSTGDDGVLNGLPGSNLSDIFNMGDGNDGGLGNGGDDVFNGGNGDDWFDGGAGNDRMDGGAGYDWFAGGPVNDTYDGGADLDMVSYAWAASAVNIDLNQATQSDGDGGTDTLINVEHVRGSAFDDTLTGDGNDNLFQGIGGSDSFDGGTGVDTVSYQKDFKFGGTSGVTVDLGAGTATDGFGNTDTLINIENARGSQYDDVLIGSSGNNYLRGYEGNDTLETGGGDDVITGAAGSDTIILGLTTYDPATGSPTSFDTVNNGNNTIRIGLNPADGSSDTIIGFDHGSPAAGGDIVQLTLPNATASPITVGFTQVSVTDLTLSNVAIMAEVTTALNLLDPATMSNDMVELLLVSDSTTGTQLMQLDPAAPTSIAATPLASFDLVTDMPSLADGQSIIVTNPVF